MVHKDLNAGFRSSSSQESFVADRLSDMNQNLDKIRKLIQAAELVGSCG